jgi:hypothetical protein
LELDALRYHLGQHTWSEILFRTNIQIVCDYFLRVKGCYTEFCMPSKAVRRGLRDPFIESLPIKRNKLPLRGQKDLAFKRANNVNNIIAIIT